MYNFITTHKNNLEFKKSKYFKKNLGYSISIRSDNKRKLSLNDSDKFVKFYLETYKTLIYSEGNIGSLNFFTDHYINGNTIVVFHKDKNFLFEHNPSLLKLKGIDGYIGSFIEEIETKHLYIIEEAKELEVVDLETEGDESKLTMNPGSVSYADIQKYMKKKLNKR